MRPNPQEIVDLVTFNEEILKENLHFLCSDYFCMENSSLPILRIFIITVFHFMKCNG